MTERKEWRCFHCDEVFTTTMAARDHFGPYEDSKPACQVSVSDRGILGELRRVEIELSELWSKVHNDGTEAARSIMAQISRHERQLVEAEEAGYARGLRDAKKEQS